MIQTLNYEAYFEEIARHYIPIRHSEDRQRFAMMDIDDILNKVRGKLDLDSPCLILENPEGEFEYANDGYRDMLRGAFLILRRVRKGDEAMKREVINENKLHAFRIFSIIHHHKREILQGRRNPRTILAKYFTDSARYQKVSNVFDNCHGWRVEFDLGGGGIPGPITDFYDG